MRLMMSDQKNEISSDFSLSDDYGRLNANTMRPPKNRGKKKHPLRNFESVADIFLVLKFTVITNQQLLKGKKLMRM